MTALNESCGRGSIPEPDFTDEIEPGMTSLGMYWHDGGNGLHVQIDRDGVGWSWFDRPAQSVRLVQSTVDAPPPLEFVRAMRRNCKQT